MSKPNNGGPSMGARKPKAVKFIAKTTDLLRYNEGAKRRGKGKERAVLKGLHDLIKANDNLPATVQVERFAETRAIEILALQNAVKLAASQSNNRAFQSVPRHLRRRAASHNPRRVPKRLRSKAAFEIDDGDIIARVIRKKAKLRARGNLRGESRTDQLRRRQVDKRWLATHLFNAKRFHLVNLWGYRLPLTPTLKSFRSSYRSARRKAILNDVSYFGTIELEGTREEIISLLEKVTAGGPFAGSRYEDGTRMAQTTFYEANSFPHGLIGPADVMWQPVDVSQTGQRRVWIRVHPSIYDEVLTALQSQTLDGAGSSSANASSVRVKDIRKDIETFEIVGPLAGQMIKRAFRLCNSESNQKRRELETLLQRDPATCPDGAVIGYKIYDPRLSFPPLRLRDDVNDGQVGTASLPLTPDKASSELWDESQRHSLSKPRFQKSDLDLRRHKLALPGSRLRPTAQDDRIPMILIKRTVQSGTPNDENAAFHGYTLLFPRGWAMAILPSLIYCGVRLGGLVERRNQYREAGAPSFPEHWGSVCPAGAQSEEEQSREDEERWLRKPPGKRPEYSTLGTQWPFRPDWNAVLSGVSNAEEMELNGSTSKVEPWLFNPALGPHMKQFADAADPARRILAAINTFRRRRGMSLLPRDTGAALLQSGVCHVEVNVIGRGSPSDMAAIYALDAAERTAWLTAHERDSQDVAMPAFDEQGSEMLRLGEAENPNKVIGFVSTGNISLTRGHGHGLATVSLAGYLDLVTAARASSQPDLVVAKVKNRDGRMCRLVSLTLVL